MSAGGATAVSRVSRCTGGLRNWLAELWETILLGCVIADTSALDSCATCESARPYVEEMLRIRTLRRPAPRPRWCPGHPDRRHGAGLTKH